MSEYPTEINSWKHSNLLDQCIGNKAKIKLLILDIDGVLTDGTKVYTQDHQPVYNFSKFNLITIKPIKKGEELTLKYTFYKV